MHFFCLKNYGNPNPFNNIIYICVCSIWLHFNKNNMKKLIYISLILFIVAGCTTQDKDFTDGSVEFKSVDKVPIVEGKLNNKKAYYIVDSGASFSVLDESQSKSYNFTSYENPEYGSGIGYGGIARFKQAANVDAFIGGVKINTIFRSQNLNTLSEYINKQYGLRIVGIVGCDWLKTNKIIIDFKEGVLKK